jgi:hypothetical protein
MFAWAQAEHIHLKQTEKSDESLKHGCEGALMSEREPRNTTHQRTSLGFVLLLLLSSLGVLATVPTASAASGELGITGSISPMPDTWYDSFGTITFTAEVTNFYFSPSGVARTLTWYVCTGSVTQSDCLSQFTATGSFNMANINGNSSDTFTSSTQWIPGNVNGIHTILYSFSSNDADSSNDQFLFYINLTTNFVDVVVDEEHNPIEHLPNLALYDGEMVLNTATDYEFKSKGEAQICSICSFSGEFGWQLWDTEGVVLLKERYRSVTTLPAWSGPSPFNLNLPVFNFNQEGRFLLKFGLFNSSGNPYGDLNGNNNVASFEIVLNDSIDLKVLDVYPSHSAQAMVFYYGTDRVVAEISNPGNRTVTNATASFEVYDQQYELEVTDSCDLPVMHPGDTVLCTFNLTTTGASRLLRVQLPTIFQIGKDVRMGDNLYSLTADVEIGPINPTVQTNSDTDVYLTTDDIELVGRFNEVASQPLNYTWREGFYVWGYGQVLNRTGAEFGLGHHELSLQVRDPWGNTEYASVEFDVLNAVNLTVEPYFTGYATTDQPVNFNHEILLPHLGVSYNIGQGRSPLMLISLEIEGVNGNTNGLRGLEVDLNLSAILPENIDFSSIDVRYLPSTDSTFWTYVEGVDGYEFNGEGDRMTVTLTKDGVLMLIGVLPETNVTALDFEWTQRKAGQIQLDWTAQGDITNPYMGGWNLYKIQGISGTTVFPDPAGGVNDAIWDELTMDTLVATLSPESTQWIDPDHLETGICASYAVAPIDREGNPHFDMVNVTRVNGIATLLCGDAIPPTTSIEQFSHSWKFTNSTDCYELRKDWSQCYEVTLTWTWPNHEAQGNISWNLYRVEFAPSDTDLRFIQPIAEGLSGVPGEPATFLQTGLENDGIRPYRTYYYILAPIDSVGNELMVANYPSDNVERVQIDNDWWAYNQHLIPPEPEPPEPPLGIPWLQKLNDATSVPEFQIAGVALLATIVLNFILLPLMLKKRKRLKRVLEARARNRFAAESDFDDFFE